MQLKNLANVSGSQLFLALTLAASVSSIVLGNSAQPERVSLIRLLAEPAAFDGRKIQVAGFFVFEEENHALYFSSDDANNGISNGGIELNFYHSPFRPMAPQRFDRKYVSVIGVFHAHGTSQWPMSSMSGISPLTLTDIENVRTPPYVYGPPEQVGKIDQLP